MTSYGSWIEFAITPMSGSGGCPQSLRCPSEGTAHPSPPLPAPPPVLPGGTALTVPSGVPLRSPRPHQGPVHEGLTPWDPPEALPPQGSLVQRELTLSAFPRQSRSWDPTLQLEETSRATGQGRGAGEHSRSRVWGAEFKDGPALSQLEPEAMMGSLPRSGSLLTPVTLRRVPAGPGPCEQGVPSGSSPKRKSEGAHPPPA